ncbi:MAG: hypothetical protein V4473_00675 [Patescibacteria group bacterium]
MDEEKENPKEEVDEIDEELKTLMQEHDIDEDVAEKAQELIDEGLDEDDAVEIASDL